MKRNYRSEALAAIHETMEGLHEARAISKMTMRKFDELCLTPVEPLAPEEIQALRRREGVSQNVFARYLNVGRKLIGEWSAAKRSRLGRRSSCFAS